jgi:trans-2,3-dihydro-3-hydroxyanthranilate isomerase
MEYKYHIVDVCTEEIFGGAQIAVFPNANGLDKITM